MLIYSRSRPPRHVFENKESHTFFQNSAKSQDSYFLSFNVFFYLSDLVLHKQRLHRAFTKRDVAQLTPSLHHTQHIHTLCSHVCMCMWLYVCAQVRSHTGTSVHACAHVLACTHMHACHILVCACVCMHGRFRPQANGL